MGGGVPDSRLQGDPTAAQHIISSNCFPTYGSDRGKLIEMWETSHMLQEEKVKGRPLTLYEQVILWGFPS